MPTIHPYHPDNPLLTPSQVIQELLNPSSEVSIGLQRAGFNAVHQRKDRIITYSINNGECHESRSSKAKATMYVEEGRAEWVSPAHTAIVFLTPDYQALCVQHAHEARLAWIAAGPRVHPPSQMPIAPSPETIAKWLACWRTTEAAVFPPWGDAGQRHGGRVVTA